MKVGYARTSTIEQVAGLDAQLRDLAAAGAEKVFSEQLSSVDADRTQLEAALEFVREGDTFVVTKIDRLARSIRNLIEIADELERKRVALQILSPSMDTGTPAGRLTMNIFASVAQFEREIMLERQREGIQAAKAAGKYRGRAPTALAHTANVVALARDGAKPADIVKKLGISRTSVWRILHGNAEQNQ